MFQVKSILPGEFGDRVDMWSAVLITVTVECFPELSNEDARVDIDVDADDAPSLPITTSPAELKNSTEIKLNLKYKNKNISREFFYYSQVTRSVIQKKWAFTLIKDCETLVRYLENYHSYLGCIVYYL